MMISSSTVDRVCGYRLETRRNSSRWTPEVRRPGRGLTTAKTVAKVSVKTLMRGAKRADVRYQLPRHHPRDRYHLVRSLGRRLDPTDRPGDRLLTPAIRSAWTGQSGLPGGLAAAVTSINSRAADPRSSTQQPAQRGRGVAEVLADGTAQVCLVGEAQLGGEPGQMRLALLDPV